MDVDGGSSWLVSKSKLPALKELALDPSFLQLVDLFGMAILQPAILLEAKI